MSTYKLGIQELKVLGEEYCIIDIKDDLISASPKVETNLCSKCESSFGGKRFD